MTVSPNTIPSLITALSFSNFSKVIVKTNTFNGQSDLKELRFENKTQYFKLRLFDEKKLTAKRLLRDC